MRLERREARRGRDGKPVAYRNNSGRFEHTAARTTRGGAWRRGRAEQSEERARVLLKNHSNTRTRAQSHVEAASAAARHAGAGCRRISTVSSC